MVVETGQQAHIQNEKAVFEALRGHPFIINLAGTRKLIRPHNAFIQSNTSKRTRTHKYMHIHAHAHLHSHVFNYMRMQTRTATRSTF
jgi:hypothetical protein